MGGEYASSEYSMQEYSFAGVEPTKGGGENQRMTTPRTALGRAIAEIRAERQLTQPQLADRAGIEQPKISKIERGKQDTTADVIAAIGAALGVKVSEIWARAESEMGNRPAQEPRLTKEGSKAPASKRLNSYRDDNDIMAVQWALGALVAHLAASKPSEAGKLVAALERIPKKYQMTGPGGALLNRLTEVRAEYGVPAKAQHAS